MPVTNRCDRTNCKPRAGMIAWPHATMHCKHRSRAPVQITQTPLSNELKVKAKRGAKRQSSYFGKHQRCDSRPSNSLAVMTDPSTPLSFTILSHGIYAKLAIPHEPHLLAQMLIDRSAEDARRETLWLHRRFCQPKLLLAMITPCHNFLYVWLTWLQPLATWNKLTNGSARLTCT